MGELQSRAIVELSLSIACKSRWGKDVTVEQIVKQATKEIVNLLNSRLRQEDDVKMIGTPKVQTVIGRWVRDIDDLEPKECSGGIRKGVG